MFFRRRDLMPFVIALTRRLGQMVGLVSSLSEVPEQTWPCGKCWPGRRSPSAPERAKTAPLIRVLARRTSYRTSSIFAKSAFCCLAGSSKEPMLQTGDFSTDKIVCHCVFLSGDFLNHASLKYLQDGFEVCVERRLLIGSSRPGNGCIGSVGPQ